MATFEQSLAYQYADFVDSRQFTAMKDILADDFTQKGPTWTCSSRDEFLKQLDELAENFTTTFHLVANQVGEWDEDSYHGKTYCKATHLYTKDGIDRKVDMAICYHDAIKRLSDRFVYTKRDIDIIWQTDTPLVI